MKQSLWAYVPALLLGSMFIGLGSMAYVAVHDPHFALEPNYYDKAVHWDDGLAEERASRDLGLTLALDELRIAPTGNAPLLVKLSAASGQELHGQLTLEAFPNAFAGQIQHLTLHETAPGIYTGALTKPLPGLWELRFVLTQGGHRYRETVRRDIAKGGAA
jgi:hypothetical protein